MSGSERRVGYSVSYRNHWWKRRRYACGNVDLLDAQVAAFKMSVRGYRRVRIERTV